MTDEAGLLAAIDAFSSSCLLVMGDLMLDQFIWGEVSRISPEAPVPVVEVHHETAMLGGAANVANNLRALGGNVVLGGVVGSDQTGKAIRQMAEGQGIELVAVEEEGRRTTVKTRIIARGQQVVRVDMENRMDIADVTLKAVTSAICGLGDRLDGIIISDYAKGVVTRGLMEAVMEMAAANGTPVLVDPKPANMHLYKGVSLVTPNKKEAESLAGFKIDSEKDLVRAGGVIQKALGVKAVLITMGPRGMALWQEGEGLFTIPTMAREIFDVTGAGDTVIATIALGLSSGLGLKSAAYLANIAAGAVVGKAGTAVVAADELKEAVSSHEHA
ncbi:MAG: D-glycero-beta-D-manno-heptose-7-phosphate kinase [Desulfobacteraceae bacterium]|nr:D-glycero-beta-D-manno-heptose-7-phosphate kinase [Desulfobacteraceae bacterium]